MRRLLVFTTLALLSACGSPGLAPPPPAPADSYTGSYTGSAVDNLGRAGLELVLLQTGDTLSGEMRLTFKVGPARYTAAGDVTGRVDGETLRLRLTPDDPDYCPYQASVTRVDPETNAKLSGSYTGVGCVGTIKGTLSLEKQ